MNEKEFMNNVWDVLVGNTRFMTQTKFLRKYLHYFVEMDCADNSILITDGEDKWKLSLTKVK